MTDKETRPILCGKCHVAVEVRANDNIDMVVCPTCGASDTVENATREAADYLAAKIERELLAPFESFPGNNSLKVTVTHSPQRTYRFILG
jgi:NMD protein affecting ribosome stability and mRNA decay